MGVAFYTPKQNNTLKGVGEYENSKAEIPFPTLKFLKFTRLLIKNFTNWLTD